MNVKGLIAAYLASSSVSLFKPENRSQFNFGKDQSSIRMRDFLINTSVPVTRISNMLTFTDSNKSFKLDGDLFKTMTNYIFNVDHSNPQDRKLIYGFEKEMNFIINQVGRKSLGRGLF